jgi:hypothetical protein
LLIAKGRCGGELVCCCGRSRHRGCCCLASPVTGRQGPSPHPPFGPHLLWRDVRAQLLDSVAHRVQQQHARGVARRCQAADLPSAAQRRAAARGKGLGTAKPTHPRLLQGMQCGCGCDAETASTCALGLCIHRLQAHGQCGRSFVLSTPPPTSRLRCVGPRSPMPAITLRPSSSIATWSPHRSWLPSTDTMRAWGLGGGGGGGQPKVGRRWKVACCVGSRGSSVAQLPRQWLDRHARRSARVCPLRFWCVGPPGAHLGSRAEELGAAGRHV